MQHILRLLFIVTILTGCMSWWPQPQRITPPEQVPFWSEGDIIPHQERARNIKICAQDFETLDRIECDQDND